MSEPDVRTLFDYLRNARAAKAGDVTALDKYRETPRPPKAVSKQPEPKPGPAAPVQKGLL